MTSMKPPERRCANEGCERIAEPDSLLCSECSLEWSLFHREVRIEDMANGGVPVPGPGIPVPLPH
jgi:hypothetical protein